MGAPVTINGVTSAHFLCRVEEVSGDGDVSTVTLEATQDKVYMN